MEVVRGDLVLDVVPAPDVDLWDFWGLFAAGTWEPETFEVLDRFLTPGGTYVDLGAWIGPTVLYASSRCSLVVAVEPDPVAFDQLRHNLELNGFQNHVLYQGAVDTHPDGTALYMHGLWGDSMSTTMVPGPLEMIVPTQTLQDLTVRWEGIDLVKMDIEGAEARVLPESIDYLAERRIPCLISLHQPLWGPGGDAAVNQALERFDRVTVVSNAAPWEWRTVLGEWE